MQIRYFKIIGLAGLVALGLSACKKDLTNTVLQSPSGITGFTASASTLVLSTDNDSATVTSFSWQAPSYGFAAAVTYTLYIDIPSDTGGTAGWANAVKVPIPTGSLTRAYLGTDLNRVLNQLGLPFGSPSAVVVRL